MRDGCGAAVIADAGQRGEKRFVQVPLSLSEARIDLYLDREIARQWLHGLYASYERAGDDAFRVVGRKDAYQSTGGRPARL